MKDYKDTYHNQIWVYTHIKDFFEVKEFFRPGVIKIMKKRYPQSYESKLWSYLDFRMLSNLLYIRREKGKAITINLGGSVQMGYRDNLCSMLLKKAARGILYLSAHTRGSGIDFHVKDETAEETRDWIVEQDTAMPFPLRLEWKMKKKGVWTPITWVHMDVNFELGNPYIYRFFV